jgi:hypothetical protein
MTLRQNVRRAGYHLLRRRVTRREEGRFGVLRNDVGIPVWRVQQQNININFLQYLRIISFLIIFRQQILM